MANHGSRKSRDARKLYDGFSEGFNDGLNKENEDVRPFFSPSYSYIAGELVAGLGEPKSAYYGLRDLSRKVLRKRWYEPAIIIFAAFLAMWSFFAVSDAQFMDKSPTGFSVSSCPASACGGKCGSYSSYPNLMFHTPGTIQAGKYTGLAYRLCGCSYSSYTRCPDGCDTETGKCKSYTTTTTVYSQCTQTACGGKCGAYNSYPDYMFHTQGTIQTGAYAGKAYRLCGCPYASAIKCANGCDPETGRCISSTATTTMKTTTTANTIATTSTTSLSTTTTSTTEKTTTTIIKSEATTSTTTTKTTTTTVKSTTTTTISCTSGRYCNKEVLVLVDSETYASISQELETYRADVKRDIGANVVIYSNSWSSAAQVRDVIKSHYQQGNFLGTVLVGNIPYATVEIYPHDNTVLTDWIYQELDGDLSDTDSDGKYNFVAGKRDAFSARIKPVLTGTDGIKQVKDYFIKNHEYRNKDYYSGTLYYSWMKINQGLSESQYTSSYSSLGSYVGIPGSTTAFYKVSSEEQKAGLLQEYAKPYKMAFANMHGSYSAQWTGGSSYISTSDIRNSKSNSMFVMLASCSNGAFKNQDYIAGDFLFYGNTLAVEANSCDAMIVGGGDMEYFDPYIPLSAGVILGEVYLNDRGYLSNHLFGDPTISLAKKTVNYPAISMPTNPIQAGDVKAGESSYLVSSITNSGKDYLNMKYGSMGAYSWHQIIRADGTVQNNGWVNLNPGEAWTIKVVVDGSKTTGLRGIVRDSIMFYTNDPANPYFRISFDANMVE